MQISNRFNLPRLWFAIYRQVLALNRKLSHERLDRSQLREVATSIFIASTNSRRGIVWPVAPDSFQQSVLELLDQVTRRENQEKIYRELRQLVQSTNGSPQPAEREGCGPGT